MRIKSIFLLSIFYFLFSIFYFLFSPFAAQASILYAGSAQEAVEEGQTFVVEWFLDTEGKSLNTLNLKLDYSPDTLEVEEINTGKSLLTLFAEAPQFSQSTGKISLTGGAPGGFIGQKVPLFSITFLALKSGNGSVVMDKDSHALLSDGAGTEDILYFKELNFSIVPKGTLTAKISSPTHPDQGLWYSANKAVINFETVTGEEYSYSFSSNSEITPDGVVDEIKEEYEFLDLPDGIYYFRLSSKIGESNWQEVGTYRVQIDSTPPEEFTPVLGQVDEIFNGNAFFSASAVDKTSGISYYKFKSGLVNGTFVTARPQKILPLFFGREIEVQAFDRAGNVRAAKVFAPGKVSWLYFGFAIGLVATLIAVLIIRKRIPKIKRDKITS